MPLVPHLSANQKGFSLAELMVSVTLGLIVMVGVASVFSANVRGNTALLQSARMNQDMSTVMTIINGELRRAGYTGGDGTLYNAEEDIKIVNSSCILYSYDADKSNDVESAADLPDDDEKFGFKLTDSELQMRTSCTGDTCFTDCSQGTWQSVTDNNVIEITELAFTSEHSKCQNVSKSTYWITTNEDATQHPCAATAGTDVTSYDSLTATATGTFVVPADTDRLIETRQVNTTIISRLVTDNDFTKTLTSSVRLRNDRVVE